MQMTSWLPVPADSDFTIHNLPFGIFSTDNNQPGAGIAIGDKIVDLFALAALGLLDGIPFDHLTLMMPSLNAFIRCGKSVTSAVRLQVQELLTNPESPLRKYPDAFVNQQDAKMYLPVEIGDYTDFYSSIEHATNVGIMFRDPANALLPNWRHLPVGYHGRASSIVVSGTPVRRPWGQVMPKGAETPVYQASARLDFELETAFIIGKDTAMGHTVSTDDAPDYIFGMVLFNDWSARDIQSWEYVPLGPFLGKNFASSVSPWVVTMDALEPFRVPGPEQNPPVLSYLQTAGNNNYDIQLEVGIQPENSTETVVCRSNFKFMYWNMLQQLAHHTVNGCNIRVGDLMASGTISGKDPGSYGSMLELAWQGTKPIAMADGSERTFIKDGDTVTMRGWAEKDGVRVGFGRVAGKVME